MTSSQEKFVVNKRDLYCGCGLLFIILLLLKVGVVETAVMGWSWWWIAAPLWGPACLFLVITLAILVIFLVGLPGKFTMDLIDKKNKK